MQSTHPNLSDEEIGRRGRALYDSRLRGRVETESNIGKHIVIDIETGDYEVDPDGLAASRRVLERQPNAILYGARIGYDAVYSLDGALTRTAGG